MSSSSSGSQKLSILAIRIGLLWRPSCCPGELFDQLFQRADAAGQGDEGVRPLEHQPFALVHVVGDDRFLGARSARFRAWSGIRDDAGDPSAVVQHGLGYRAHQADGAAAIDQADMPCSAMISPSVTADLTKLGLVPGPEPQ